MPDSKTTDDRYAMRPIDVELYETCAKGTLAQVKALLAPIENARTLLECGFDPNTQTEDENGNPCPIVDRLSEEKRELFLQFGARPIGKRRPAPQETERTASRKRTGGSL